jgi:hypothetical protein
VFVDSCYRVLELTDDRDKFVLYYDGASITDSRDNRCTPIVKIQYDNSFNEHNFCVELVSAPNTCRNSVVFQVDNLMLYVDLLKAMRKICI